jgi:hypothetical protein
MMNTKDCELSDTDWCADAASDMFGVIPAAHSEIPLRQIVQRLSSWAAAANVSCRSSNRSPPQPHEFGSRQNLLGLDNLRTKG